VRDALKADRARLAAEESAQWERCFGSAALPNRAAQVERIDQLVGDLVQRMEQAIGAFQAGLAAPVREGRALLSGLRAALAAIRDLRGNPRGRRSREDEDALFI